MSNELLYTVLVLLPFLIFSLYILKIKTSKKKDEVLRAKETNVDWQDFFHEADKEESWSGLHQPRRKYVSFLTMGVNGVDFQDMPQDEFESFIEKNYIKELIDSNNIKNDEEKEKVRRTLHSESSYLVSYWDDERNYDGLENGLNSFLNRYFTLSR